MVDVNILAEKLKQLSRSVAKVRTHCPADPGALAADDDALDLVSFNLLLAVQSSLDLASHLIADEGWEPAATARETFERLGEHGVLSRETVRSLGQAVGLRNVVAHGYARVDPAQVHAAAIGGPADLERFAEEVSAWVEREAESAG